MTERRENIARADTRWAKAYEEWNAGPRELGTGRRAAFLAGWQAARQALIADAAIAADDGAIGRVLALAERYETNAKYLRGLGQGGPTTAALERAAEDIHAAVGATVAADGPAISRVLALAERWGRDLSPHWQEAGRKLTAAVGTPESLSTAATRSTTKDEQL